MCGRNVGSETTTDLVIIIIAGLLYTCIINSVSSKSSFSRFQYICDGFWSKSQHIVLEIRRH